MRPLLHSSMMIFHAIDNKLFKHGSLDAFSKRQAFKNLSWLDEKPRTARGQIFSLTADSPTDETQIQRCSLADPTFFSLTTAKPTAEEASEIANELKNLAEKSNFIVPYTLASSSEDFAETLTVYYFGAYLNNWQKRDVRFDGPSIYLHDTEAIVKTKQQHKSKICAAAKLVFGSCNL